MSFDLKREDGFTIQELMVVLVIGSILVGSLWEVYRFTQRLTISWRKTTELHEAVSRVLSTLSQDIIESNLVIVLNDTSLEIEKGSPARRVSYNLRSGSISRVNVPFHQPDGSYLNVKITEVQRGLGGEPRMVRIFASGESRMGEIISDSVLVGIPYSSRADYLHANREVLKEQ